MTTTSDKATAPASLVPRHAIWRSAGLLAVAWVLLALLFGKLYFTASRTIINEVRSQAMGTAIAVAAAISADDLAPIQAPEHAQLETYRKLQSFLSNVSSTNPDVRYIYVMRRSTEPQAAVSDYIYVVDELERDRNANGEIDAAERSEPPGAAYDAAELPAMIKAWDEPAADEEITADPPYPDLLSGYAPIRDRSNQTAAIVGVDIVASTIAEKQLLLKSMIVSGALILAVLLAVIIWLYDSQQRTLEKNRALSHELASRNQLLRSANQELLRLNLRYEEELKLAQDVQMGLLPKLFPQHRRMSFEKCFVTCAMLGGDIYDAFSIDDNHIALYVADVAGHGASAALISGLLKMAMESLKFGAAAEGRPSPMLAPREVVRAINNLLAKEMPSDKFVTLVYAVFDLEKNICRVSNAGHPPPVVHRAGSQDPFYWNMPTGPAIGLLPEFDYEETEQPISTSEKLLFYTDGLTEAMDADQQEFGESRLLKIIADEGDKSSTVLMESINRELAQHRGATEVSDDYTLLVVEFSGQPQSSKG